MKSVDDNFLSQVLSETTRKDALLDVVFVNREGLMGDVLLDGFPGHSGHEMVEFKIFSVIRRKDSRAATVRRANFKVFGKLFNRVPCESGSEGLGCHRCWSVFKNYLLQAREQAVLLCHKSGKWGRRPAWLNRKLLMELKTKKKFYNLWKQGQALEKEGGAVVHRCREKTENSTGVETGQCCA